MVFQLNRRRLITSALAAGALASGPRLSSAQAPLKVGFVYSSPVGDFGWSYQHDVGRRDVEKEFGDAVETNFIESVPEGSDSERVISRFARSGHGLIFTCSFGYMDPTIAVAQQFPEVKFEHNTGYKTAPNVSAYNARFHEGRSVFGTIAARMSRTGIVGYIGSFPIPEVIMGMNAFAVAARRERPDIKVRVIWVNKWFDPGLEADAAKVLIDNGADFITQHTNSTAPCQVSEERGVYCFGQDSDMSKFAPTRHLTAIVNNWSPYYVQRVRDVLEGNWESQSIWHGMAEGLVKLAPYNPIMPSEVAAAAEATRTGIISGDIHPFAGPIRNRAGEVVAAEGEVIPDKEIHSMNWFVEGIEGDLPS